jgi:poly(rC)-binding protein 2/3/4
MAGAKPHFAPHAAYGVSASASAPASDSISSNSTASEGADADVIVFRLLLPRAFGDEDAFHLYAAIVPLRRHTAALQVRVDALQGYPEDSASRVAVVLVPTSPTRRVEASSSSGEPLHLSPVQEALVALVDVGGVLHRVPGRGPEFVTCLVLVEAARLDAQGRGTLREIASETGAEIRVTPLAGNAKPSLHSPDEVIEVYSTTYY